MGGAIGPETRHNDPVLPCYTNKCSHLIANFRIFLVRPYCLAHIDLIKIYGHRLAAKLNRSSATRSISFAPTTWPLNFPRPAGRGAGNSIHPGLRRAFACAARQGLRRLGAKDRESRRARSGCLPSTSVNIEGVVTSMDAGQSERWFQRPGIWFWAAMAIGAALRLYLVVWTEGTRDVEL
jgi:hypothetical protein